MSDQDYDNTIDYLDGRVEELEGRVAALEVELQDRAKAAAYMDRRRRVRITDLEAELQVAHEIGSRHATRVGEQALEIQALRDAAQAVEARIVGLTRCYEQQVYANVVVLGT
jgi:hypothetical protein